MSSVITNKSLKKKIKANGRARYLTDMDRDPEMLFNKFDRIDARNAKRGRFKVTTLNSKQIKAIELMTDLLTRPSMREIAEQVGVNLSTLYYWRNKKMFAEEVDRQLTLKKGAVRLEAFQNIFKKVMSGHIGTSWKYLKMVGDLKEHVVNENIEKTEDRSEADLDQEIKGLQDELGISIDIDDES